MNAPGDADRLALRAPRRRRRTIRRALAALAVSCLLLAAYGYWKLSLQVGVNKAIEEMDRENPGWREKELLAQRASVPDDQNSARCILAAVEVLPPEKPPQFEKDEESEPWSKLFLRGQPCRLTDRQADLLRQELDKHQAGLIEARNLTGLPRGRYSRALGDTTLPVAYALRIARLLRDDAVLRAQENDPEGALLSCQAAVNALRSVGDARDFWLQKCRAGLLVLPCQAIERCLAQGRCSRPEVLAGLQHLLEDEEDQPILLYALQGRLASVHAIFEDLEAGRVRRREVNTCFGAAAVLPWPPPSPKQQIEDFYLRDALKADHARFLHGMRHLIATARQPFPRYLEMTRPVSSADDGYIRNFADEVIPYLRENHGLGSASFFRSQAYLRCTVALLAAERYSLARGHLPASVAELVPGFLPALPLDPWDGKPLRLRRFEQGIVIYSLGHNGQDDGGDVEQDASGRWPPDLGLRLWEVQHRRQPPLPPDE